MRQGCYHRRERRSFLLLLLLALPITPLIGQIPGDDPGDRPVAEADSLFTFDPVRPLIDSSAFSIDLPSAFGGVLAFGASGYGAGLFYEHSVGRSTSVSIDAVITGLRTSQEIETFNQDPESVHFQSYSVPGKINRLWQIPVLVGLKRELFRDVFFDNFRPFVSLSAGGSMVLATPYDQRFFSAFGDASVRIGPALALGLGAEFTDTRPGPGLSLRYTYVPLDPPVFSLRDEPISDAGGLLVALSIPF